MKKLITIACLFVVTAVAIVLFVASSTANAESKSDIEGTRADTIYYVSAAGNDSTGTPNNPNKPYRSPLGAGAGAYSDIPADITKRKGDHIIQFMDSSTYGQLNMTPKITDATHRIILRAAPGTTPTMDADSTADGSRGDVADNLTLRVLAHNVVVQGLHFTNTNVDSAITGEVREVMVHLEGSNVVFHGNFFDGTGRTSTVTDIGVFVCGTAANNTFSSNRWDNLGAKSQLHVSALCGGAPGALIIRNNVFSRFSQSRPTAIGAALNFGGLCCSLAGDGSIVENNTFWNNGGAHYGLLNTNGSALTVRNNIFSAITGAGVAAIGCNKATGSSSGFAFNSVMFGNTNDVEIGCPGAGWNLRTTYASDPYFVNTAATPPDLHVESTGGSRRNNSSAWTIDSRCSAAIDKAPATDSYNLEPSPNGGRRNIGAYGNTAEASKSCISLFSPKH